MKTTFGRLFVSGGVGRLAKAFAGLGMLVVVAALATAASAETVTVPLTDPSRPPPFRNIPGPYAD